MKNFLFVFAAAAFFPAALMAQEKINPTDPQPTCAMCPGTLIPLAELEAYKEKAIAEKLVDQQVRDIDIGKAHIGIGMVYRRKLDKPAPDSVAEHDQVSDVHHIISGSATLGLGPDLVNRQRRPATLRTAVEFNGPAHNRSALGACCGSGRCESRARRHCRYARAYRRQRPACEPGRDGFPGAERHGPVSR